VSRIVATIVARGGPREVTGRRPGEAQNQDAIADKPQQPINSWLMRNVANGGAIIGLLMLQE